MAFKHISANRLSFLLTADGVPSGLLVNGENIPIGSLAIDRVNAKLYQLKPNLAWTEIGTGGGGGTVPSQVYEQLVSASTSAPFVFHLGFNPVAGSVKVFVNGLLVKANPLTNYDYTLSGTTVTWSNTPSFAIDHSDDIIVYYDTLDF